MGCCNQSERGQELPNYSKTQNPSLILKNGSSQQTTSHQIRPSDKTLINQFMDLLKNQLENNKTYDLLMDKNELIELINQSKSMFLNHQQTTQVLDIVIEYMKLSQKYANDQPRLSYQQYHALVIQMAKRWTSLKKQVDFRTLDALKVMDYIVRKQQGQPRMYRRCFLDLKFDFQIQEVQHMAASTRRMCRYDQRAMCFLSNYFLKCCLNQQQKGVSLQQIQQKLKSTLKHIQNLYPSKPPQNQDKKLIQAHPSLDNSKVWQHSTIDLSGVSPTDRQGKINQFLTQYVGQCKKQFDVFIQLIRDSCLSQGMLLKSKLKILSENDKKGFDQAKQQLVKYVVDKSKVKQFMKANPKASIQDLQNYELELHKNKINEIYANQSKVTFQINNIVKAKCILQGFDRLNNCCTLILNKIKRDHSNKYVLIDVENKIVQRPNHGIFIHVLVGGKVAAQLQLVTDNNLANEEFAYQFSKLYTSKHFSLITTIKRFNDQCSKVFFSKMWEIVNKNSSNGSLFSQRFSRIKNHYSQMLRILPFDFDVTKPLPSLVNMSYLGDYIDSYCNLQNKKTKSVERDQALYFWNNHVYHKQAGMQIKILRTFQALQLKYKNNEGYQHMQKIIGTVKVQSMQALSPTLNNKKSSQLEQSSNPLKKRISQRETSVDQQIKTASVIFKQYKQKQDYYNQQYLQDLGKALKGRDNQRALRYYQKSLELNQKVKGIYSPECISNLNDIARLFKQQGRRQQALEYSSRSRKNQQKATGPDSIQMVIPLKNQAAVYEQLKNYHQCLKHYHTCLSIQQKKKGLNSNECAQTLCRIAQIHQKQKKNDQAIETYDKCLQIYQKTKGKTSMASSNTLIAQGKLYKKIHMNKQALACFQQSLEIIQRYKGKHSVQYARVLRLISNIYLHQGDYNKSMEYDKQCLQICQRQKGVMSLQCAAVHSDIGHILLLQDKYQEAFQNYQTGLKIQSKHLGPGSQECVNSLNHLANVLRKQKTFDNALSYYQRCLTAKSTLTTDQSVDFQGILNDFGQLYQSKKNQQQALDFYQKCLDIQTKVKGRNSLVCANTLNQIGMLYQHQKKFNKALEYYQQSLGIIQKITGQNSVEYGNTLKYIGTNYEAQGNMKMAKKYYNHNKELQTKFTSQIL